MCDCVLVEPVGGDRSKCLLHVGGRVRRKTPARCAGLQRGNRAHDQGFQAGVSGANPRAEGRAQRRDHYDRRHGLRSSQHVRRADSHAHARSPCQERAALQSFSHDGPLLAHAGGLVDRTQSSLRRLGHGRGIRYRLPGYNSRLPANAALLSQVLQGNGYSTAAFGKWHNTPNWESGPTGPFDRWPTNLGFQYFYGFLGGDTNQWSPGLVENTKRIEPPYDPNYHLMTDMTNRAIDWVRVQKTTQPQKPFFVYFAPGATHAPHHAPKSWIDRFKGQFDQGWDKVREETFARQKQLGVIPSDTILTPRHKSIPAWNSLSNVDKRLYARMQEVFAGYLAYTDSEIGRLIDAVAQLGELDNTIVVYIVGDNGASPEGGVPGTDNEGKRFNAIVDTAAANRKVIDQLGGPMAYNNYPVGWAFAGNTPFKWTKQIASHFGGTRNPMVISWPSRIKDKGGLRTQFHHVVDLAPTLYEAIGIRPPAEVNGIAQKPLEGVSLVYTFDHPRAKGRHLTQYFEMLGSRALYHDGWVAAAFHGRIPWDVFPLSGNVDVDDEPWELYNIDNDFSEATDLAKSNPKQLRALQAMFWIEAGKYQVLPIDDRTAGRMLNNPQPQVAPGRTKATFYRGIVLPEAVAPNTKNRSYAITAFVD
ncbi:MAG TPA: sulfatase-like hydrolase/transferase [Planctomycetaceae bacterium]|nr:sulfatase-like hydrolase/transferase [Planctomycetaceae bacterium]